MNNNKGRVRATIATTLTTINTIRKVDWRRKVVVMTPQQVARIITSEISCMVDRTICQPSVVSLTNGIQIPTASIGNDWAATRKRGSVTN